MTHDSSANGVIKWSEHPGRFERHLQRRLGNPLFTPDRQNVSAEEVAEAVEKDRQEHDKFWTWFRAFIRTFEETNGADSDLKESWNLAKELTDWIPYAAGIGGLAGSKVKDMRIILEDLFQSMDAKFPQSKKINDELRNLIALDSIPFIAGIKLPDNPIPQEEQAAAILCEDIMTIAIAGEVSRRFGEEFHPSEAYLLELVQKGQSLKWFTKEQVREITDAITGNTR